MENQGFLESARLQFEYYKLLGEKTFAQVSDEQLFYAVNEESNSIATIVQHLHGNMMSRWTGFLTTDGEKEWRQRDEEFENKISSREHMMARWDEGWKCLFDSLSSLKNEDLATIVYIRNQGHTVTDAIIRQLCHYAYHTGQIVYIGKMAANEKWKSLSIPKKQSKAYNAEKFSKEKHEAHFTTEYLKKDKGQP
jgi:hypothetical protein